MAIRARALAWLRGLKRSPDPQPPAEALDALREALAARSGLSRAGERDVFARCAGFTAPARARALGIYPYFTEIERSDGPTARIGGREVLMLGSNNYLGLATDPRVREAAVRAIRAHGTGVTGSRLMNGTLSLHRALEERLAAFVGAPSAMITTTGYQMALAAIGALGSHRGTAVVLDEEAHASAMDGARLARAVGARWVRFTHDDPLALDARLAALAPDEGALVVTDGVFSTHGEICRLPELLAVCRRHRARLFLDDAHGLGVLGPGGRGTAARFGVAVDLLGGTFSKSLASTGGWLAGDAAVIEFIRHFGSSFLFSAAPPPAAVAAAHAALDVLEAEPWRQERLGRNHARLREGLAGLGLSLGPSQAAVVSVRVGDDARAFQAWRALLDAGVFTNAFITPATPPGAQLLRLSVMATHTTRQIDRAIEVFSRVAPRFGLSTASRATTAAR